MVIIPLAPMCATHPIQNTPLAQRRAVRFLLNFGNFRPDDAKQFSVDTQTAEYHDDPSQAGVSWLSLCQDEIESVSMVDVAPNQMFDIDTPNGAELLVVSGVLIDSKQKLTEQDWLRVPLSSRIKVKAGTQGVRFWLKTGHLRDVENQIQRVQQA